MAKISVKNFIAELDSYFARENLGDAGQCLLEWRERAVGAGDKSGELTVLNEMIGFYRQTKDEKAGMAAIKDAFLIIDELEIGGEISAATIYLNGATTMKSFGRSADEWNSMNVLLRFTGQKCPKKVRFLQDFTTTWLLLCRI